MLMRTTYINGVTHVNDTHAFRLPVIGSVNAPFAGEVRPFALAAYQKL